MTKRKGKQPASAGMTVSIEEIGGETLAVLALNPDGEPPEDALRIAMPRDVLDHLIGVLVEARHKLHPEERN